MASKVHENELAEYTSEDVDQTLFANNPARHMNNLNLQMEPRSNNKRTKTAGN